MALFLADERFPALASGAAVTFCFCSCSCALLGQCPSYSRGYGLGRRRRDRLAFTTALVVGVVSIATASPGLLGIGDRHRRAADRPAIARVARHAIDKALAPKRHACSVQNERGRQLRRPYFLSPSGARNVWAFNLAQSKEAAYPLLLLHAGVVLIFLI
jgi:hypothetical protein